jgi:hypothetical protein
MDFWEFVNQKEWGEAASEAALDQEARDFWESLGEEDQARVKAQIQQVHTLARGIVSDLTEGVSWKEFLNQEDQVGGAYLNDLNEWLRQVPTNPEVRQQALATVLRVLPPEQRKEATAGLREALRLCRAAQTQRRDWRLAVIVSDLEKVLEEARL